MQTIYCDIDGVLYDWDAAANHILKRETGKTLTYPSPGWDTLEQEAGPEAWNQLWTTYVGELFTRGPAIQGAKETLKELYVHFLVTLVTSRPKEIEEITKIWLSQENIKFDDLILCGRHTSKPAILPEPPDFFIDDKPSNIVEAQKIWGLSDEQVFVFPATYNDDFDHPSKVKGWEEILEKILGI